MKNSQTILVIEDDPWFAEQHLRVLKKANFNTMHAPDGIAAISMFDEALPDAVVLDIFLPGPNAMVLLHEMQSHADLSMLPVIICTGSASDISLERLASYGVVDVLDKNTMQPGDVVSAVRRVLL